MAKGTLTVDRLREVLDYDPLTGVFTWKSSHYRRRGNTRAGYTHDGYVRILIDGSFYQAHRLAWLWVHGVWPVDQIDHRNGDKRNNRIANLREATNAENTQNVIRLRCDNKSGYPGVTRRGNRWSASIGLNGKKHHLGNYATPEEASAAYLAAKAELHPFWDDQPARWGDDNPAADQSTPSRAENPHAAR